MTVEEAAEITRRCVQEVWNEGNLSVVDELYAPNYVHHSYPGLSPGPAGYKEIVREFRQAFTDFRLVVEDLVVQGDKSATRWSIQGVHGGGVLLGVAPTGKHVKIEGIVIARVQDGKVAEEWEQFNALDLMEQLGVAPQAPDADAHPT